MCFSSRSLACPLLASAGTVPAKTRDEVAFSYSKQTVVGGYTLMNKRD